MARLVLGDTDSATDDLTAAIETGASQPATVAHAQLSVLAIISRNTVKSEAVSIYRKLGVSSRSEAIARAVELGLLEESIYPPGVNFTPEG